jgi:DNA-binding protein HU-beta
MVAASLPPLRHSYNPDPDATYEELLDEYSEMVGYLAESVDLFLAETMGALFEAQAAVDCVFNTIKKALKKRDTVTLIGFGTFKVDKRKARKGRNPQTGEEMIIPATKVVKFKPGKLLKEAVK